MVTPVRAILRAAVRAWGIEPAARLALARAAWPRLVGPALASSSAPVGLRGGRLLVGAKHAAAGQEIRLRGPEIVRALARELQEDAITEVVPVARQHLELAVTRGSKSARTRMRPRAGR